MVIRRRNRCRHKKRVYIDPQDESDEENVPSLEQAMVLQQFVLDVQRQGELQDLGSTASNLGTDQQDKFNGQDDGLSLEQTLVQQLDVPQETEPQNLGTARSSIVRRCRGKAICRGLDHILAGEGMNIEFLDGSPVGPNSDTFLSYLGTLIRSHVPLQTKDYRKVSEAVRETIIQKLQAHFRWERTEKLDRQILSHGGDFFRRYKCQLRKLHFKQKPFEEAREQVPQGVDSDQWRALCDRWASSEYISLAKKNKANRACAIQPIHRMGRKNINQKKYEFMKVHGRNATRPELFEISKCTVTTDGSQHWIHERYKKQHESMTQLMVASVESDGRSPRSTADEAFCHATGHEHPGRVTSDGRGWRHKLWPGGSSASTQRADLSMVEDINERVTSLTKENENLKKIMEEQGAQLKDQKDMMSEMMVQMKKMQETMDAVRQEKVEEEKRRVGLRGRKKLG